MTAGQGIEHGWKASTLTTASTLLSMWHTDDTLDEEDVLMSWKHKTNISQNFDSRLP